MINPYYGREFVGEKPLMAKEVKRKYRFHYLGLVHLPVSDEYVGCAFTQKIFKLCKMLVSLGHEVILYGAEGSNAECTQFIQTHTLQELRKQWGDPGNNENIGYDYHKEMFRHDFNGKETTLKRKYINRVLAHLSKNKKPDDFILNPMGTYFKEITKKSGLFLVCEPGIGYRGSCEKYKAFESSYIQNFTYGSNHPRKSLNGNYYDRVIPNYFNPDDFRYEEKKDDYFLYFGRLITRKGILTAIKTAKALGMKLRIAGQGFKSFENGKLITDEFTVEGDNLEYIGFLSKDKRKEAVAKAKAVFVPTLYLEPFGGTNVEAQISGTPVLTTNFGAFLDTVINGVTGFRCDTLNDFVEAAKNIDTLDPKIIRKHGERYFMDVVKWEFQKWFDDLYQLYLSAKGDGTKGWHYIERMPDVEIEQAQEWEQAQKWESDWWGTCSNTLNEEIKQLEYAKFMEIDIIEQYGIKYLDLHGASVLDIGGGPSSLLLKAPTKDQCNNSPVYSGRVASRGRSYVIDPCRFPSWVKERYLASEIKFMNIAAEDIKLISQDEIWIYNVLQHTMDPEKILRTIRESGKILRIFEWLNTSITSGHPHSFTKKYIDNILGINGKSKKINTPPLRGTAYYGRYDLSKNKRGEL